MITARANSGLAISARAVGLTMGPRSSVPGLDTPQTRQRARARKEVPIRDSEHACTSSSLALRPPHCWSGQVAFASDSAMAASKDLESTLR